MTAALASGSAVTLLLLGGAAGVLAAWAVVELADFLASRRPPRPPRRHDGERERW